jgi:hypothetical protein
MAIFAPVASSGSISGGLLVKPFVLVRRLA